MFYFTSDQHFGEDRITTDRSYNNSTEMDDAIIRNHNVVVSNNDIVFMLGDFVDEEGAWSGYYQSLLRRLNGQKHLILGNHDIVNPWFHVKNGFMSVHTHYLLIVDDLQLVLVHDPAESNFYRDKIYICGHVHKLFKTLKNVINVGVDVWDYKPVSLDEIKSVIEDRGIRGAI